MTNPVVTEQNSDSSGTAPKPSDMPRAAAESSPATEARPAATESAPAPEGEAEPAVERSELERLATALGGEEGLRSILREERRWERRAKELREKADKFDELEKAKLTNEERYQAERDQAQRDLAEERRERLREKVARETSVPPEQITGDDEDAMRDSAAKALEWAQSLRKTPTTSAPPASMVTGDGKPPGKPGQITSREELKSMTPQQILAADAEGRLDEMKGVTQ